MTPEQWERVNEVLGKALELNPTERKAYLREACNNDPFLHREVQRLLVADDLADSKFLSPGTVRPDSETDEEKTPDAMLGRRLGNYQTCELLGVGGMGEVYRAFRADDQYRKQVALKLVRSGQGSQFVFERFRNERQILATLDHPNIARLLDGGTTEEGAPYFVMELIEGQPLGEYCEERKLGISDRLRLFLQVCSAVQFAHQRLVVHRDLKPSNILVTPDGTPKLLDFGVSKILDSDGSPSSADPTLTAFRALTPAYASPEQIKGASITTATDVYSLGVVLYELLTGRTPYPVATRSPHEISHAICEVEPERPSVAVRKALPQEDRLASDGHGMQPSSAKLSKQLKGDLDSVVLMALRKEPERRYASVEEFAGDIRRHLEHLPVAARKGTARYRAAKFVLRHRSGLAATSLLILSLAAGLIATLWQARIARSERARAERRFNDVRTLANSMIFDLPRPIHALPGAVAVEKMLYDNGLKYLDGLATEAEGDVSLQRELAAGYKQLGDSSGGPYAGNLGDSAGALADYRKALQIRETIAKSSMANIQDQIDLAKSHRTLGFLLYETGDLSGAHEHVHRALGIAQPVADAHGDNVKALLELSIGLLTVGNVDGEYWDNGFTGQPSVALAYHLDSLKVIQRIAERQPEENLWRQQTIYMFGIISSDYLQAAKPGEAIDYAQKALQSLNRLELTGPVGSAMMTNQRAAIHSILGHAFLFTSRFKEALSEYEEAHSLFRKLFDPQDFRSRSSLSGTYLDLGHSKALVGETTSGLRDIREGLDILRQGNTTGSPDKYAVPLFAQGYMFEGEVLEQMGDLSAALDSYQKALTQFQSSVLDEFPHRGLLVAAALVSAARVSDKLGQAERARTNYQEALRLVEPAATSKPTNVLAQYVLTAAYAGIGELTDSGSEACAFYQKGMDIWKTLPVQSTHTPDGFKVTDYRTVAEQLARCVR